MSVPSIPKDQFLAIKQLWQTKLALEEKVKSLEAICNINGNLKSILENLTKEFRAIPGSSISDTTGGSTVVDPATINHELLGGLLGGADNDHNHLTTLEKFKSQEPYDVWKPILSNTTGFKTNNLVVINGDTTTYKVTLTGTIEAYYKGTQVTALVSGWISGAHGTDTAKVYILRYAGSTFDWIDLTTTPLDFTWLLIAYTFYDTVAGKWVYLREPHGFMDAECHKSDHLSKGTYKLSGGTPSGTVLDSTTAADRRPLVSETVIKDEDIDTTIPALATEIYTQAKLTSTGIVNFAVDVADIVRLSTNRPYYNTFSTPNWSDTLFPSQSVGSIWCFVLPAAADANSQKYRFIHFMPQWVTTSGVPTVAGMNTATTQELTRNVSELNLGNFTNIIPESVAIIRYVIAYDATGYANNWVLKNVSVLSGSRVSQISTPAGNFLSTVSVDETLSGNGTILSPLSVALTPVDTASIDLTITGKSISGSVLPAGVDHNSLNNLNAGTTYQHLTSTQVAALHAKAHAITSTSDHTSGATAGKMLKADASGLPIDATNTDTQVAAAVTASHVRQHSLQSTDDHTSTATAGRILKSDANGLPIHTGLAETAIIAGPVTILAADVDTAVANGFYSVIATGQSDGLLVFTPGGSIGTVQLYFAYTGLMQWRNKTDSTSWTAWKSYSINTHVHNSLAASDGSPDPALSADAAGNIGIGTITPDSKVHVKGSNPVFKIEDVDGDDEGATLHLRTGTYDAKIKNKASVGIVIDTESAANALTITHVGKVGIGTTPSEQLEVAGNIKSTGAYNNKLILQNTETPVSGPSVSIELDDTGTTPNKHRIYFESLTNSTYLEHKNNGGADLGRITIVSDDSTGSLWIANKAASPALNDNMGGLTFGAAGGVSSSFFVARHGDYGTYKTGGGQLILYQRDSTDTLRQNVTFDGLNRRIGINDAAPAEALDVTGNINATGVIKIGDTQILKERQAAISDASAGTEITTINSILAALRAHGLIAT